MQLPFPATPRRQTFATALAISAIGLVLSASVTWAQSSGGPYTLRKVVIASGAQSNGAPFAAVLTVGQPVAGTSNGGPYRLRAGIHPLRAGATGGGDRVFCDGFESNACP
jgi:hypothetical protein